jgi:hypothetical protein
VKRHKRVFLAREKVLERDGAGGDDGAKGLVEAELGALQREGAVVQLVVELAALVIDAVVLDDRRDEAEAACSSQFKKK